MTYINPISIPIISAFIKIKIMQNPVIPRTNEFKLIF